MILDMRYIKRWVTDETQSHIQRCETVLQMLVDYDSKLDEFQVWIDVPTVEVE